MSDLIKVEATGEKPTVLGRDLHAALEVETAYKDWFPRMCEYGFSEGTDFNPLKIERVQIEGGREVVREVTDHQLTLEMAKELCMLQRTEKGKECRQYFIELERRWNDPASLMARALVAADHQIASLREANAKLLPKAEFCDAVTDSKDAIPIGTVAKVLNCGMGQNRLFAFLRENNILMANNQPYQKYIDEGWFRCIESKYDVQGETRIYIKTVVFQKGIRKILEMILGKEKTA
ncbi:MAG: phage antirepressor KilAC domain-containing protein [Eubacteriales bacterium]|nr:phage antirepressor KilAC domain-containing protein [Eubacteriales bacterium]